MALVLCRETTKIHSGAPNATCSCTLQPSRLFPALGDGLAIWPLLCLSGFQDISGQSFFSFRWTRVEPDRAVFVFDSVQDTTSPRGFPAGCTSSSSMANTPCARAGEPHPHWSQPYRIPASTLASAAIPRQLAAAAASQHATWHTNAFQIGAIHVLLPTPYSHQSGRGAPPSPEQSLFLQLLLTPPIAGAVASALLLLLPLTFEYWAPSFHKQSAPPPYLFFINMKTYIFVLLYIHIYSSDISWCRYFNTIIYFDLRVRWMLRS